MKKEIPLTVIDSKNENEQDERLDSDSYLENDLYDEQSDVRNPKIPDSLKTPEPSKKQLIQIKKIPSKLSLFTKLVERFITNPLSKPHNLFGILPGVI